MSSINASTVEVTNDFRVYGNIYVFGNVISENTTVISNVVVENTNTTVLTTEAVKIDLGVISNPSVELTTSNAFKIQNTVVSTDEPVVMSIIPGVTEVIGNNLEFSFVEFAVPVVELSANFSNSSTLTIEGEPTIIDGTGTISNSYAILIESGTVGIEGGIPSENPSEGTLVTNGGIGIDKNIYLEDAGIHFGGNTTTMFVGILNDNPQIHNYTPLLIESNTTINAIPSSIISGDVSPAVLYQNMEKTTTGYDFSFIKLQQTTVDKPQIWKQVSIPFGNWKDLAWNGSIYCAIGTNCCATSSDGTIWNVRTVPTGQWNAILWNGTIFCVVGNGQNVLTSINGVSWNTQTGAADRNWNALTWNGTIFCAVASNTGAGTKTMTSSNGVNWTIGVTSFSQPLYSIAWGSNKFVASGNTIVAYSSDGSTWNISANAAFVGGALAYGNEFVYIADGGNFTSATSPDGIVWTTHAVGKVIGTQYKKMIYSNGYYYVCDASNNACIAYSSDGTSFMFEYLSEGVNSVCVGNNNAVAVSASGVAYASNSLDQFSHLITSTGLLSSEETLIKGDMSITKDVNIGGGLSPWTNNPMTGKNITCCGYGDNKFVIASDAEKYFYISYDGNVWQKTQSYLGEIKTMLYANDVFLAFGTSNQYYSLDGGLTWTEVTGITSGVDYFGSIAWSGTTFCAMRGATVPKCYVSPDGINWTAGNIGIGTWLSVNWTNNTFVATTENKIATSVDGETWVESQGAGNILNGYYLNYCEYFEGVYYLYTNNNIIFYSNDLNSWSSYTNTPRIYNKVVNINNELLVGWGDRLNENQYRIYVSSDGYTWFGQPVNTQVSFGRGYSVCWSPDFKCVLVTDYAYGIFKSSTYYPSNDVTIGELQLSNINLKGKELTVQGFNCNSFVVYPAYESTTPLNYAKFYANKVFGLYELSFEIEYAGSSSTTLTIYTEQLKVSSINLSNGNNVICCVSSKDTTTPYVSATISGIGGTEKIDIVVSNTSAVLAKVYGFIVFEYKDV